MYTQEPITRQYSDLPHDAYSRASSSSQQRGERGLTLISASAGQIEGGASMSTTYTCSLTMAEMTEGVSKLVFYAQLTEGRTANIFSITMKNNGHLRFLQLFYYDEEQRTSSLPAAVLLR